MLLFSTTDASYEQQRLARCINGEVVSESESDNPEEYLNVKNSQNINDAGKKIILKKRNAIKWRALRFHVKAIAERFLSRKVSKRVSKIVRDCPNILVRRLRLLLKITVLVQTHGGELAF